MMEIKEIDKRYSALAETDCCLSCGGAINLADPQLGDVCVDLGSGRGTDALRMAEIVGDTGFIYGIDISGGMIDKARKSAEKFGVLNVCFIQSELEQITLPDRTADLVISNCTLNHASDKLAVWKEIFRILKKDGRFVISDIYATLPIAEEYRTDPVAVAECWAGAITRDEYMRHLEEAGFVTVEILEESAPYKKGQAEVASFTLAGKKTKACGCGH
ncbi:MAG: methyltransferase domain-containing protein [Bacteroidota bacterium]